MAPDSLRLLGIETSCDETAAAVVADGRTVLSDVIASQVDVHHPYGGVVPELASRNHLVHLPPVVRRALADADCAWDDLDGVAVTRGPGLMGALLVGVAFAKAMAYSRGLPLVAVNHLEGHLRSPFLEPPYRDGAPVPYPLLTLVVSGGHTNLYLMEDEDRIQQLGRTRDDAAGEAFDKIAKYVGLGYPGGPQVDRWAKRGDPTAHRFTPVKLKSGGYDFSFSGLKSAVLRVMDQERIAPLAPAASIADRQDLLDLLASFQAAAVRALVRQTMRAAQTTGVRALTASGGVAANSLLRQRLTEEATKAGLAVWFPSLKHATDNAAMIAAAACRILRRGGTESWDLDATPSLRQF